MYLHPNYSSVAFSTGQLEREQPMRTAASLFVGLTVFATEALVGPGSLDGTQALAASRGYSSSMSQSRTMTGGYSSSAPRGRTPTGGFNPTSLSQGNGPRAGGMVGGPGRLNWSGQKRYTGADKTQFQKAQGNRYGMGNPRPPGTTVNWSGQARNTRNDPVPKGRAAQQRTPCNFPGSPVPCR